MRRRVWCTESSRTVDDARLVQREKTLCSVYDVYSERTVIFVEACLADRFGRLRGRCLALLVEDATRN